MLRARILAGAGVAACASAFTINAPHARCLTLDVDAPTARSLLSSLKMAMAKPPLVAQWEEKQGEHAWLEDVLGEEALDWVRAGNAEALAAIGGDPTGSAMYNRLFGILTSKEKIPYLRKIGPRYYNFWTDEENPRGVMRRTDLESYQAGTPDWEAEPHPPWHRTAVG